MIYVPHRPSIINTQNLQVGFLPAAPWPWSRFSFQHKGVPNEYQMYLLGGKGWQCLGLITLPHSCLDCPDFWEPQLSGALGEYPGL